MLKKYVRQTFANIEQGVREPRSIGTMFRNALIKLCRSRGGGLYGLGYVVTFVVLETKAIGLQIIESENGAATLAGLALEVVLRLGVDTLENMVVAFIWPAKVMQHFGGWGLLALVVAFAGYNRFLRPVTERFVPELKREPKPNSTELSVLAAEDVKEGDVQEMKDLKDLDKK